MPYAYKILKTDTPTASEEQLNEFGKAGWLLTAIIPWEGNYYYYLVRELDTIH